MKPFKKVDEDGIVRYRNEKGQFYIEDGPAVIWSDGDCWYFLNDMRYNKDDWEEEVLNIKLERIKDL